MNAPDQASAATTVASFCPQVLGTAARIATAISPIWHGPASASSQQMRFPQCPVEGVAQSFPRRWHLPNSRSRPQSPWAMTRLVSSCRHDYWVEHQPKNCQRLRQRQRTPPSSEKPLGVVGIDGLFVRSRRFFLFFAKATNNRYCLTVFTTDTVYCL